VGKVGEAEPAAEEAPTEETTDELNLDLEGGDETTEEGAEEPSEEADLADLEADLIDLDLEEPAEEEKKEESFTAHTGEALVEDLTDDKELDAKLEAHNEYIEYLRTAIAQEEEKLEKATNEQVKVAIQRNIDAFKADLESALPEAVKNDVAIEPEEPVEEPTEEPAEEPASEEAPAEAEAQEESSETEPTNESLTEGLHEEAAEGSSENFEKLMKSDEFKKPISDAEVRAMLAADKEEEPKKEESLDSVFSEVDELQEDDLEGMISDSLVEMYKNVDSFKLTACSYADNKFMVEGVISFKSGKTRNTTYTFNEAFVEADTITLRGLNEKLGTDKHFYIAGRAENKTFITESIRITKD
jgi:hypothetical protein